MTDQRVSSDTPLTRRQLRQAERARTTGKPRPASPGRWLGRMSIVAALAAATWVVPATGVVFPQVEEEQDRPPILADASALDVLLDGPPEETEAANGLLADPGATSRALVAASRSLAERGAPSCGMAAVEANGPLAAESSSSDVDLVMPLSQGSYRLTSHYGYRIHPVFGSYAQHTGLDFAAPTGTPIHAIADGVVTHAGQGRDGRSGMLVIIEHDVNGAPVWSWYVHMYPNGVYVDVGQQVAAGEVIGAVGSYGNSTGPHLHLEIHTDENLTTVDPNSWLSQQGALPLNAETMACAQD
ncbi:MAG TPA: M23 family metallopeptidase [Beutenbergiaceae bacterium]|nr:M23 family metallopeptidase [Beutenbergiaceae bacterium]